MFIYLLQVPVKIILLLNNKNDLPVFNNLNPSLVSVPYYAFIGSYVATIIAFDPVYNILIQNYSINSQPTNPDTNKPYFRIDTVNG